MVLAFVAAEIESPKWGPRYSLHLETSRRTRHELLDHPKFNPVDNEDRADLLKAVRGYGNNDGLFTGFPTDVVWRRADLTPADLAVLRYAKCDPWTTLAPRTLKLVDGAANLDRIETRDDYRSKVHEVLAGIRRGDVFQPLILAETNAHDLILIEGHTRATAYALEGTMHPVQALIGASPTWSTWPFSRLPF